MGTISLLSLFHDRGKLLAALAGVTFATTLMLVQIGLYVGFREMSSAIISRVGGDLWVMPRGVRVIDNSEILSAGVGALAASHPCVRHARPLLYGFSTVRRQSGSRIFVSVVGFEPDPRRLFPWSLAQGLPGDLHAPGRISVDALELRKLQIDGAPLGQGLQFDSGQVHIAALTQGIRSFTLNPLLFCELPTARRILGVAEERVSYWILDVPDPACRPSVARFIENEHDLMVRTTEDFVRSTEEFWVVGSGAGAALGFSALLGLLVGLVIVGQTLYALTKERLRELAMLKAVGASDGELVQYVAWQVAFLLVLGTALGAGAAFACRSALAGMGLSVVLSGEVLLTGLCAVSLMCVVASAASARAVLVMEPAIVFQ